MPRYDDAFVVAEARPARPASVRVEKPHLDAALVEEDDDLAGRVRRAAGLDRPLAGVPRHEVAAGREGGLGGVRAIAEVADLVGSDVGEPIRSHSARERDGEGARRRRTRTD